MKQTLTVLVFTTLSISMLFGLILLIEVLRPDSAYGSQIQGNDYNATSTGSSAARGSATLTSGVIKTGQGALAQVSLLGATAGGEINFYDATTTDITKRATGQSTSTVLITTFPSTAVGGTYIFDIEFQTGLMYDVPVGTVPTTTISYR